MKEKIYFYYTNDLHSNFNQWPRTAGYLKDMKSSRQTRGDAHFLVDIGDHMDRVHPISEASMGKANVELLNEVGYDAVTLGNNEGITLSHDDLYHLYDEADFQVVCANLKHKEEHPPDWLHDTQVLRTESGVRIGLIGLTAPFNAFYQLLGWHLTSPFEELEKQLDSLKQKTDIIILLSHLGLSEDEAIARKFPDIDVIIGGHTHHLLRTGEYVNNSLLTAAGKHCMYVGEVILTYDHDKRELTHKEAYTTDVSSYSENEDTSILLDELAAKAGNVLEEEVVYLEEGFETDWFHDVPMMQDLTETVRKWTDADASLLNAGLLLDGLPKGMVTYGDIHRICPHPINPVVVHLRGDELIEVIRASLQKDFMEIQLKGFGFRGKVIGRMLFSGLSISTTIRANGREAVTGVMFQDGSAVEKEKTYRIATADTFTFGRLLPEIAKSEMKQYFLPEFLRDLLLDTLKNKTPQA
ncbi:bifunctional metallophosphatase/5'-nucleotidase [Oceanobacillus alkalisoli]|uniref:bifunctional metallophosphatase/5'-nucleotidase n=1 Tax=Oceanobacillus alkalisoli TaxID=2925113 RepID=UPI001F1209CE|nr:bifunctional UDP-sugar hydrolase/5'-nucleotidase [Oceanobacillus alkalisoli]MCF3943249.1 bifunctional metallophosphatase/5'-nucleotidase [Oceanobacillus alkalisoli]